MNKLQLAACSVLVAGMCSCLSGNGSSDADSRKNEKLEELNRQFEAGNMTASEYNKKRAEILEATGRDNKEFFGSVGGHQYVDLGLSVKWATCNLGAGKEVGSGEFYAWGEIQPKSRYNWKNYALSKGSDHMLTKYCSESIYGVDDKKSLLEESDDAASANWGKKWRIPTSAECDELKNGCTWVWTNDYNGTGVAGRKGTSIKNGAVIFFPAAGFRLDDKLSGVGELGYYWASNLDKNDNGSACFLYLDGSCLVTSSYFRMGGLNIRPVVVK